jgi:MinD superfamily P-loop ATPase
MVAALGIPFGVVINQSDIGDNRIHQYCRERGIEVLLEIPHDRRVAEAYSRGQLPAEILPEYADGIRSLRSRLEEIAP